MLAQEKSKLQPSTSSQCPYFQDFGEPGGRGWCALFDRMARAHYQRTNDCDLEIEVLEQKLPSQPEPAVEPQKAELEQTQTQLPAGLAGDTASCQLQPKQEAATEFEQGHIHGQHDARARLHSIYTEGSCAESWGYLQGYNSVLNATKRTHSKAIIHQKA